MRINARLDEEMQRKITYILDRIPISQSELVKNAINLYYESVRKENQPSVKILLESGFIGGGQGPADLSESYKDHLIQQLHEKYDHR